MSVAATFAGAWEGVAFGVSMADGTTRALADAAGIDGGAGGDTMVNGGDMVSRAAAEADAKSIAVTVSVAPKGVSAGLAMARAGIEATAGAAGMRGGAGNDAVTNTALMDVDATTTATAKVISVNVATVGAAMVDVSTTSRATAVGMDGGSGVDVLWNQGAIEAGASSTIDAKTTAVNFVGYTSADASMTNVASATGMTVGAPAAGEPVVGETIYNAAGGSVTVSSYAKTDTKNQVIQGEAGRLWMRRRWATRWRRGWRGEREAT